jgi:hypothetical protein
MPPEEGQITEEGPPKKDMSFLGDDGGTNQKRKTEEGHT